MEEVGDGVMQILSKKAVFNNYTELRDSIIAQYYRWNLLMGRR